MILDNFDKYLLTKLMGWETSAKIEKGVIFGSYSIDNGDGEPFTVESWEPEQDEEVMEQIIFKCLETLRSEK